MQDSPKLVMVFGTFDYLHAGHQSYIEQARKHGQQVIAVIARDHTVKKIKGRLPDHNEKERLAKLKESGWVDKAILGNTQDKHKIILKYKPDIIALGYDQFAFTFLLNKTIIENKLSCKVVRLTAYRPEVYKSSIIKANNNAKKKEPLQPLLPL